jgi:hypothetical protein
MANGTQTTDQAPKDMMGFLEYYLVTKAPFQLPDNVKEFLVKFGPWIALVLMIISLPVLLFALGLGAMLTPFAGVGFGYSYGYLLLFTVVGFVLEAVALPGLFARKMSGWRMMFYAQLVQIVGSLLSGAVIGALVGGLIGLYILFQVRPLYHE